MPRPRPRASCPYRCGAPSGVWDASEYEKLPEYDRALQDQPMAVFYCHPGDGAVCSGWLGHRDPSDLLGVRLGLIEGSLDPACLDYRTEVTLFGSGAEAAGTSATRARTPARPSTS
ncbi:DUF6283 family protein [Sinomonas cellulolyticus]|uniref:DUF6283 family protein n=1 Tax=Sinomonas cellulolyticus TaxID=2801916 RepID=UPI001E59F992|nr:MULTISPECIES: DUF6283 family protein [Sinomonas]